MARKKSADDIANEMLAQVDLSHAVCNSRIEGLQETVTELRHQNEQLFDLLQKIVNGATGSMGVNSVGREYAHIPQNVLDLGRVVLREAGRPTSDPVPYVDTKAKYGFR